MIVPTKRPLEMTVEEYLATEVLSDVKREYLGGVIYARAEVSEAHNYVATNLIALLCTQLRGTPCEPFGSDMRLRLRPLDSTYFYYPDAMVACDPTDSGHGWRERPAALFEIISEVVRLPELGIELPLAELFERVKFS